MKKNILSVVLFFVLYSCGNSGKKNAENKIDQASPDSRDTARIENFRSPLRPNTKLEIGKNYSDTVEFIQTNYDYDYWLMYAKKRGDTLGFIIDKEYDFALGDQLAVIWKVDSMRIAGDGESLHFSEWLISADRLVAQSRTVDIPVKDFPITDSTSFDSFEKEGVPDHEILSRIKSYIQREDVKNLRVKCRIPFSDKFTSLVVSYQSGEHEVFATLFTFNEDNDMIDKLDIAYDEIAESAFSKTSVIQKARIVVTEWNYMNETPEQTTQTYTVQDNGKFNKIGQIR